jgi:hypothetical protein
MEYFFFCILLFVIFMQAAFIVHLQRRLKKALENEGRGPDGKYTGAADEH